MVRFDLSSELVERGLATRVIGRRVVYLRETSSTMDVAHREAESGAPDGTVIIAEEQTAGRGRFDRRWVSNAGQNLTLSVLLRPRVEALRQINMAACLSVVRAIRAATGLSPTIKWPNDVRIGGRKACGILIESRVEEGQLGYMVVGIGLNVNFDPTSHDDIAPIATSLMLEAGRPIPRLSLCRTLLTEFDRLYATSGDAVREEWRGALETLGRQVRVRWGDVVDEGLAADVDAEGNLVLQLKDGTYTTLVAGEVTLQV
jgi:BirA family transcriptional regulator, biotin operon repressor / biotin---[acetyl-CoA-carboxylase] ligase